MSITVRFTGICTHVKSMGQTDHRVVLVDADHGAYINGKKIPPHIPKLRLNPEEIVGTPTGTMDGLEPTGTDGLWRLRGVYLALEQTTGDPFWVHPACDIPHLGTTTETVPLAPSTEINYNELAVACYFDLDRGVMASGRTDHGAITAVVSVQTTDSPVLRATCFWNREVTRFHLLPGATIEVEHTGVQHGDSDDDFLLHYRVFDSVPSDAIVPPEAKQSRRKNPGDISIGCSNSQWP